MTNLYFNCNRGNPKHGLFLVFDTENRPFNELVVVRSRTGSTLWILKVEVFTSCVPPWLIFVMRKLYVECKRDIRAHGPFLVYDTENRPLWLQTCIEPFMWYDMLSFIIGLLILWSAGLQSGVGPGFSCKTRKRGIKLVCQNSIVPNTRRLKQIPTAAWIVLRANPRLRCQP